MKLINLKIKDFRSYNDESTISFDNQFTSFVGKNDVGKSTIFDAISIFFGNSKPELSDLNINSSDRLIEISCVFSEFPDVLEIDAGAETNLNDEYLVNEDGFLEIKKVWRCTEKKIESSPETYIIANHPDTNQIDLLHIKKQTDLKSIGEEKGISVSDARMNHLWRKAIWQSIPDINLKITCLKIDDFETKAKKIYSKIESLLPLFFVFKSDRETTDSDSEAKDPMQLAVAEAQQLYDVEIENIKTKIQEKVDEVAKLALEKLHEVDPTLADQLKPVLKSKPSWKFDYRIEDERGVALNKRGSGTRRLVLLNFFRAQAEKKGFESEKGIIYAIEEPETSQHPDNQKLIIEALTGLASNKDRQVMITTHSPELLKDLEKNHSEGIRFIQSDSNGSRELISGSDGLILSANALGILSKQMFGSTEKIVLVESKSDCLFLEHAAEVMKKNSEISQNLQEAKVEVLPLGGCGQVKGWIEMAKHKKLGLKTFIMIDSDRLSSAGPETDNEAFINQLSTDQTVSKAFATKKREIENYIDYSLTGCSYGDYDDAKNIISKQNNISSRKVIDTYWTQMNSSQIDKEIKDIILEILK